MISFGFIFPKGRCWKKHESWNIADQCEGGRPGLSAHNATAQNILSLYLHIQSSGISETPYPFPLLSCPNQSPSYGIAETLLCTAPFLLPGAIVSAVFTCMAPETYSPSVPSSDYKPTLWRCHPLISTIYFKPHIGHLLKLKWLPLNRSLALIAFLPHGLSWKPKRRNIILMKWKTYYFCYQHFLKLNFIWVAYIYDCMLFNFQIVGGKVKSVAFSVRGGEGEKKINTLLPSLIKTV